VRSFFGTRFWASNRYKKSLVNDIKSPPSAITSQSASDCFFLSNQILGLSSMSFLSLTSLPAMPWRPEGILHGLQYAVEGILIVAQNPQLRKERYLQIFGYLLIASFTLFTISKVVIVFPLQILRLIAYLISVPGNYDNTNVDKFLLTLERYIRDGLVSLPFLALFFMRYLYPKPIDQLFMESLRYVDTQTGGRPYAPALAARSFKINYWANLRQYLIRYFKKGRIGIVVYLLSLLPFIGRFVLPAAGMARIFLIWE
jgi:hypothetical protein